MTSANTAQSSTKQQGLRFVITGGISAIPDLGLTALCQFLLGFSPAWARTVGFIVGTLTAYMLNRRWTFQAEPSLARFVQVAALYVVTYFVNVKGYELCYHLFTQWGWQHQLALLVAFVLAQGTATVINFLIQKLFIFKA